MTIALRLSKILKTIENTAISVGRNPSDITLLAVSKTKPAEDLREAYIAGQSAFGENYLQEAREKQEQLADLDIEWHFIGPIQSNKTREIAEHFDWVHSVDRLKIAKRLNDQRPDNLPSLNICLQVNVDDEETKSGISLDEVPDMVEAVGQLPNLRLRGLMAIPAPRENYKAQKAVFGQLAAACHAFPQLDTLSMGMSDDMAAAIEAGSTIVRVGTAIFGARKPQSHVQ